MIDFACKRFDLNEIIKCALGLTRADFQVLEYFINCKEDAHQISEDIAKKLSLNLSTVQRALKKLYEKGVLIRHQENISRGGYTYTYQLKDKQKVRQLLMGIINSWVHKVEDNLNRW